MKLRERELGAFTASPILGEKLGEVPIHLVNGLSIASTNSASCRRTKGMDNFDSEALS
jgi:hypothetical protein